MQDCTLTAKKFSVQRNYNQHTVRKSQIMSENWFLAETQWFFKNIQVSCFLMDIFGIKIQIILGQKLRFLDKYQNIFYDISLF